jgi:hypothetical protein
MVTARDLLLTISFFTQIETQAVTSVPAAKPLQRSQSAGVQAGSSKPATTPSRAVRTKKKKRFFPRALALLTCTFRIRRGLPPAPLPLAGAVKTEFVSSALSP